MPFLFVAGMLAAPGAVLATDPAEQGAVLSDRQILEALLPERTRSFVPRGPEIPDVGPPSP